MRALVFYTLLLATALSHAHAYQYNAHVISVYDGDTITADIDLGFGIWKSREKLRLFGIDAPEIRGSSRAAGIKSRDALREKLKDCALSLFTIKDKRGKYGRYLAKLFCGDENINDWLVFNDLAIYREY